MFHLLWWLSAPFRFLLRCLPLRYSTAFGRLLGLVWYRLLPIRRTDVRRHIARAFPELDSRQKESLVKESYLHLGQSFLELLISIGKHGRKLPIQVLGFENLQNAILLGRGVLVLSAHLGNFELLIQAAQSLPCSVHVVTKSFKSNAAQRLWQKIRSQHAENIHFSSATGSARELCQCLKSGNIVAMVLDQHAPHHFEKSLFFNHLAQSPTSLARLAKLTNSPIVPIFTHREEQTHIIEIGQITQHSGNLAHDVQIEQSLIENAIRRAPAQWLWLHRRWKPWNVR